MPELKKSKMMEAKKDLLKTREAKSDGDLHLAVEDYQEGRFFFFSILVCCNLLIFFENGGGRVKNKTTVDRGPFS